MPSRSSAPNPTQARTFSFDVQKVDGRDRRQILGRRAERGLVATEDRIDAAVDQDDRVGAELYGQVLVRAKERPHADVFETPHGYVLSRRFPEPAGQPCLRAVTGLRRGVRSRAIEMGNAVDRFVSEEAVERSEGETADAHVLPARASSTASGTAPSTS